MEASFTCWNCSQGFQTQLAERVVCPSCHEPTYLSLAHEELDQRTPEQRPSAFEAGWKFLGRVRSGRAGYEVVTEIPHAVHPCEFEGLRGGDAGHLVGTALVYEVVRRRRQTLVLRLQSELELGDGVDQRTVYIDPERLADRLRDLTEYPLGESPLERLYIAGPEQVLPRIQTLAKRKNDPAALWELAHGWRLPEIRLPIDQELRAIGAPRLVRLVMQNHIDWDAGFLDLVDELRASERKRRGGGGDTLPHNLSGWDRPWWVDD